MNIVFSQRGQRSWTKGWANTLYGQTRIQFTFTLGYCYDFFECQLVSKYGENVDIVEGGRQRRNVLSKLTFE